MKTIRSILEEVIEEYNGGFEVSDTRHIDQALAEIEDELFKAYDENFYTFKSNLHKALGKDLK